MQDAFAYCKPLDVGCHTHREILLNCEAVESNRKTQICCLPFEEKWNVFLGTYRMKDGCLGVDVLQLPHKEAVSTRGCGNL